MDAVADPKQIDDSILFPEIVIEPSAQTDESSQRTLMCKELLEAAIKGHKDNLTQLLGLAVGESPNSAHATIEATDNALNQAEKLQSRTRTGNTVLHILASNGHSDLALKTYIKDKSLLEVCNNTKETALHCAARYGHCSVISVLIGKAHEFKPDLKDTLRMKNRHGETVLHEAARHGHTATVQTLITEDLELAGQVNKNNESPLYLATVEGHIAVVRLIVEHLCHREITSEYYSGPNSRTALHAAVLRREKASLFEPRLEFIQDLGRSLKSFFRMPSKEHPGLDMASELLRLEAGTLPKIADKFGSTPLHYAASTGNARMARKLLNHDPSLAYCDDSLGLFPIHVAAYMGHSEIVIAIFENNFDSWELLDQRGRNFLHLGAEGKSAIISRLLLIAEYYASRDLEEALRKANCVRDNEENTNRYARENLREVLRKASCVKDNEGNTPLHIAARCGAVRTVDSLLQKEWVDSALPSLDSLALSNSKITTESYEKMYQHYKTQQLLWKAERSPRSWLLSYSHKQNYSESSDASATKIQTIALGSVLIATVTFAAAFTPPGGFNSSDGTPVFARKPAFMAFILADIAAFASSFLCTILLIFLGANMSGRHLQQLLYRTQYLFMTASIFTALAFALGLYVVLAPVSKGFSIFVLVAALLLAYYSGATASLFNFKIRKIVMGPNI